MNLTPAQAHEAYAGPPSEPVRVAELLESANRLEEASDEHPPLPVFSQSSAAIPGDATESWMSLTREEQDMVKAECRYVPLCCPRNRYTMTDPYDLA